MDVAISATIATALKKLIASLVSDKNGRKILLYIVGIVLFIISIPLITLIGLFGWMAGDGGTIMDKNIILAQLPEDQKSQIELLDSTCETITSVFELKGLDVSSQRKASAIYISYLVGLESNDAFYDDLASCFIDATENNDVYDLVSGRFLVSISEEDRKKMDELYGKTQTQNKNESDEADSSASSTG